MAREIGEAADEDAVVERAGDVLDEGAVDLDDVDPQPAQVAERRVAGAEVVHRDLQAQRLHRREQTLDLVDRFERQRLDDLDDQPRGRAGMRAEQRP